ncbi:hypothetical protein ACSLVQ_30405, partial [Klebsiella pneumoniae]|uniref:hypothetical protein n=1 Tax=Klebsiella pneumoniae TaxID=573 RepID=UPI003EE0ADAE
GEAHVLYLEDDYEKKLKRANGSVEGRETLDIIARGIGIDPTPYPMNSDLKSVMAARMRELFG